MKKALCIAFLALLLPACGKMDKPRAQTAEADFKSFLLASQKGDIKELKEFLASGADINAKGENGSSAIHSAVCAQDTKALEFLLANGADVNAISEDGATALHMAAFCGKLEFVKLLASYDADIALTDNKGKTPLWDAAVTGRPEVVEHLLSKGADPNIRLKFKNQSMLHMIAGTPGWGYYDRRDQYIKTVELLLREGADPDARDEDGLSPFHLAALRGFKEIIKLLLVKGVSPDTADNKLVTALHRAVKNLRYDTTQLLITEGAYINVEDDEGRTPLDYAQTREMKDLLTRQGALSGKELKGEKEE